MSTMEFHRLHVGTITDQAAPLWHEVQAQALKTRSAI
jgi:hypothetical protein